MHSKITSQQNDLYRSHDNWSKTSSVVNAPGRSCLFAITTLEALGGSLIVEFRQALELGQNRVHLLLPFFPHLSWLSTTKITPQTSGKKLAQKGSFSKSRHKYLLFLLPPISHIENIYYLNRHRNRFMLTPHPPVGSIWSIISRLSIFLIVGFPVPSKPTMRIL